MLAEASQGTWKFTSTQLWELFCSSSSTRLRTLRGIISQKIKRSSACFLSSSHTDLHCDHTGIIHGVSWVLSPLSRPVIQSLHPTQWLWYSACASHPCLMDRGRCISRPTFAILPVDRLHHMAPKDWVRRKQNGGFLTWQWRSFYCIWKVRCSNLGWNTSYPDRPPMVFLSLGQLTSFVATLRSRLLTASLCRIGWLVNWNGCGRKRRWSVICPRRTTGRNQRENLFGSPLCALTGPLECEARVVSIRWMPSLFGLQVK
jgi:hypothetical protein